MSAYNHDSERYYAGDDTFDNDAQDDAGFVGSGKIASPADQLAYILSGAKAGRRVRFTIKNTRTGRHLTYQVETARGPVKVGEGRRRFVSVLTGPDNEGSYTYLGTIFDRGTEKPWRAKWQGAKHKCEACPTTRWHYYHGSKSSISIEAPSASGFVALMVWLCPGYRPVASAWLEFWHEGRCGRCGRALTDPESIARGLGPVCAGRAV